MPPVEKSCGALLASREVPKEAAWPPMVAVLVLWRRAREARRWMGMAAVVADCDGLLLSLLGPPSSETLPREGGVPSETTTSGTGESAREGCTGLPRSLSVMAPQRFMLDALCTERRARCACACRVRDATSALQQPSSPLVRPLGISDRATGPSLGASTRSCKVPAPDCA